MNTKCPKWILRLASLTAVFTMVLGTAGQASARILFQNNPVYEIESASLMLNSVDPDSVAMFTVDGDGNLTIGDAGQTTAITTSAWGIDDTGIASGFASFDATGDITTSAGDFIATLGNIEATAGTVTAGTGVTATAGGVTATAGDITATAGDIVATAGDFTADAGDFIATLGNIEATAGSLSAGTSVTATTSLNSGSIGGVDGILNLNGLTSGTVGITVGDVAGAWTLTLPDDDGAASQFLQTNGSGVTTWASAIITEVDPDFNGWLVATPPLYSEVDPDFNGWLVATPPLYAEADTLADVTGRGALTTDPVSLQGNVTIGEDGVTTGQASFVGETDGTVNLTVAADGGDWTMTLPEDDGDANEVLTTDGSGVTSWTAVGANTDYDILKYYPEYSDATYATGNAGADQGKLETLVDTNPAYKWSTQIDTADQTILITKRFNLPTDFLKANVGDFTFQYKTSSADDADASVDVELYDVTAASTCGSIAAPVVNVAWTEDSTIDDATIAAACAAIAANDVMEVRITLLANNTVPDSYAEIGYVNLAYTK